MAVSLGCPALWSAAARGASRGGLNHGEGQLRGFSYLPITATRRFRSEKKASHPTLTAARCSDPSRGIASITPPTTSGGWPHTDTSTSQPDSALLVVVVVCTCMPRPPGARVWLRGRGPREPGPMRRSRALFWSLHFICSNTNQRDGDKREQVSRDKALSSSSPQADQHLWRSGRSGRDSRQPQQPPR